MKKIIATTLIFILIVVSCTNIFAASGHYKVALTTESSKITPGEEITVYLYVSDFQDVKNGVDVATGNFVYNSDIITLQSCEAAEGWTGLAFDNTTNYFAMESSNGQTKENQNLLKLVFKVSETAITGDVARIIFMYLDLANSETNDTTGGLGNDYDEEELPTLELTVEVQTNPGEEEPTNPEEDTTNSDEEDTTNPDEEDSTNPGEEEPTNPDDDKDNGKDDTTADKIPQTGDNATIICMLAGMLLIISVISIIKYRKMNEIR